MDECVRFHTVTSTEWEFTHYLLHQKISFRMVLKTFDYQYILYQY